MATRFSKQTLIGAAFVVVGLAVLGAELDLWTGARLHQLWPLALIAVGVGIGPQRSDGLLWIGYGGLLLLATTHVMPLRDSWPLLLVLHGLALMFPSSSCGGPRREVHRVD